MTRRRGLQGTAHVARRRMGLTPTPDALAWSCRVMVAVRVILDGWVPGTDPAPVLARMEGLQPAWRRASGLIRAGARAYR